MNSFVLPVLLDLLAEQGITEAQLLENTGLEALDLSRRSFSMRNRQMRFAVRRLHSLVTGCWALSWE